MGVDEAVNLAAQLPLIVRGLYNEGWRPSKAPVRARDRDEYFSMVERLNRNELVDPEETLTAVF